MEPDIIINENFSEDDIIFQKIEKREFSSNEIAKLKLDSEKISSDTEIKELISYDLIKKNLQYQLPHQSEGALRILRDFNGTTLLADEVGLGKTITAGIVIKECIERGFVKKILILTPPSLVDQWVSELKEKFELDFKIIESKDDWYESSYSIASLDRVKMFDKNLQRFRHETAHKIVWDLLIVDEAHKLKDKKTARWNFVDKIPRIIPVDLTQEEFEVYNDLCDFLKTKYFSATGNEINGRLIIFALLPKVTSSSRSAIESLQRIVDDEKYHEETRNIAKNILERYRNLKKDSKIERLVELVKEIMRNQKGKILMYTKHPTTLEYIVEKLAPLGYKIVKFMGGLDREEKTLRIKEFKESADIMISTETGSEGLNFQFCNNLINYDLPWNPMAVEQRIGRLDR